MSATYFNEMYEGGEVRPPYARLEDWTEGHAGRIPGR